MKKINLKNEFKINEKKCHDDIRVIKLLEKTLKTLNICKTQMNMITLEICKFYDKQNKFNNFLCHLPTIKYEIDNMVEKEKENKRNKLWH